MTELDSRQPGRADLAQRNGAVIVLILFALPIAFYGLTFPFSGVNQPFREHLDALPFGLIPHVLGSGVALLIGGLQFLPQLRVTHPSLHRLVGRIYLSSVLLGGLGGLAIATISHGGISTHIGFGMLALLWLGSGMAAWRAILRRDIPAHRRWMIRSFAMTFAAVMLRLQMPLLTVGLGASFDAAYQTVAWSAWVPNLLFAEWWLLRDVDGAATMPERTGTTSASSK